MSISNDTPPVLFLLGTLEIGGSETKFVSLANRLHKAGLPVHVAYLRGPDTLLNRIAGIPHVHLGQRGKWSYQALRALRDYVRKNSIEVIVTVNPYPLTYAAIGALRENKIAPRIIASINTSEFMSRKEQLFMLLYSRLLRRCDQVVFGSKQQQRHWVDKYNLAECNSSVIYNGVDSVYFSDGGINQHASAIRREIGIPDGSFVVACVSQFRPEKAHQMLLRAIAEVSRRRLATPHLILVGDGPERDKIIRKSKELSIEKNVHLVGAADDVRPYLKAADMFALTSVAVETFSNAALEAASMGLAVVMSDVGGAREMFPDSDDCIVYSRHDLSALTDAICVNVKRGPRRDGESSTLRSVILKHFGVDAMDNLWRNAIWPEGRSVRREDEDSFRRILN